MIRLRLAANHVTRLSGPDTRLSADCAVLKFAAPDDGALHGWATPAAVSGFSSQHMQVPTIVASSSRNTPFTR